MSTQYECVVVSGHHDEVERAFADLRTCLPIGLGALDRDLFAVYVKAVESFEVADFENLAEVLSTIFGRALAVIWDDSTGVRFSAMFTAGDLVREFDEDDEWLLPYDETPRLTIREGPYRWTDVRADAEREYDLSWDAIDAGLEALGVSDRIDSDMLLKKIYDLRSEEDWPSRSLRRR